MGCIWRGVFAAALTVAFPAAPALAQNAEDILNQVSTTYKALSEYHFQGKKIAESQSRYGSAKQETDFDIASDGPGKLKIEFDYGSGNKWVRIADGSTFTEYRSVGGKPDRRTVAPEDGRALGATIIGDFQRITQGLKSAQVVGSENIEVGNKSIECYVIEAKYESGALMPNTERLPTRLWIDKTHHLVLRRTSGTRSGDGDHATQNTRTLAFATATVDQPISQAVFAFRK